MRIAIATCIVVVASIAAAESPDSSSILLYSSMSKAMGDAKYREFIFPALCYSNQKKTFLANEKCEVPPAGAIVFADKNLPLKLTEKLPLKLVQNGISTASPTDTSIANSWFRGFLLYPARTANTLIRLHADKKVTVEEQQMLNKLFKAGVTLPVRSIERIVIDKFSLDLDSDGKTESFYVVLAVTDYRENTIQKVGQSAVYVATASAPNQFVQLAQFTDEYPNPTWSLDLRGDGKKQLIVEQKVFRKTNDYSLANTDHYSVIDTADGWVKLVDYRP